MVIWIIGLSGAGKTTLAQEIVRLARQETSNVVLIDGDVIRETFGNDLGHSIKDRRRNAERMMRLCQWLDRQGIHVVCAILSLFPEHRAWMRDNVSNYHEVFVDAPLDDLKARDGKGLYARFAAGETTDVAGLDLHFPIPDSADLTIRNDAGEAAFLAHAAPLAQRMTGA